jgi:hypothetical protein
MTIFFLKKKNPGKVLALIAIFIISGFYLMPWFNMLFDSEKIPNVSIVNDNTYRLILPICLISFVLILYVLVRIFAGIWGDILVEQYSNSFKITHILYLFKISNKYIVDKIINPRIVDRGENRYQVAFNYGEKKRYIGIGFSYPEKNANELYNNLISSIENKQPR